MTRRGGQTMLVVLSSMDDEFLLAGVWLTMGEKRIVGCYAGSCDAQRDIPKILALWRAGRLDLEGLVTRRAA